MFLKVLVGFVVGGAFSASRGAATSSLAVSAPTLDGIMDASKDVVPVRAVVVGGGYTGSRLAYHLDSMVDVTLIDEKNFFELSNDIIPVIANPWDEAKHPEACRRMMSLHRFYLKRANIVTGTVDGVDQDAVYLQDGRVVPYDLLFVSTGEKKPFPFRTEQRTISARVQELKRFNEFMQACRKVAVVGGGPVGTSLAHDLASSRPDLDVHLYHSHGELLPALPGVCRRHAEEKLRTSPNLHLHLSHRVTAVEGIGANNEPVPAPPSEAAAPTFWRRLWAWTRSPPEPLSYRVHSDMLQYTVRPQQSIISQIYFGKQDDATQSGEVEGTTVESGFDYVFPVAGDTARPIVTGHRRPNLLAAHEVPDGHYRVSTLLQLFRTPNVFACGRCTNLPVTRGYGASDIESRTLFRIISSIANNPTFRAAASSDGVQLDRMKIPRLHVRLGKDDAVGCTPWAGGLCGVSAVHEFMQDRMYLTRDFQQPTFYKQQDAATVKKHVQAWRAHSMTDIVDFSHA